MARMWIKLVCFVLLGLCVLLLIKVLLPQNPTKIVFSTYSYSALPVIVQDVLQKYNYSHYPWVVTDRQSPVDIIVRSVYFDNRTREGHTNATVFLLEVQSDILAHDHISGCGVGNVRADSYKVKCVAFVYMIFHIISSLSLS